MTTTAHLGWVARGRVLDALLHAHGADWCAVLVRLHASGELACLVALATVTLVKELETEPA